MASCAPTTRPRSYRRLYGNDRETGIAALRTFLDPRDFETTRDRPESSPEVGMFIEHIREVTNGTKLFVMGLGILGIAPPAVRVCDVVWMVKGPTMPFLLRRQQSLFLSKLPGPPQYTFVADCFQHQCMDGVYKDDLDYSLSRICICKVGIWMIWE